MIVFVTGLGFINLMYIKWVLVVGGGGWVGFHGLLWGLMVCDC